MPKFNDSHPSPSHWTDRKLLTIIGQNINAIPPAVEAMNALWARHVDKVVIYRRKVKESTASEYRSKIRGLQKLLKDDDVPNLGEDFIKENARKWNESLKPIVKE